MQSVFSLTASVNSVNKLIGQTEFTSIGLCVQDYKSVRVMVMICDTLVDAQTDTHKQISLDRLYYYISSSSQLRQNAKS